MSPKQFGPVPHLRIKKQLPEDTKSLPGNNNFQGGKIGAFSEYPFSYLALNYYQDLILIKNVELPKNLPLAIPPSSP
jgi:hypothetical protein